MSQWDDSLHALKYSSLQQLSDNDKETFDILDFTLTAYPLILDRDLSIINEFVSYVDARIQRLFSDPKAADEIRGKINELTQ